jgi:hypothetical protein
MFDMNFQMFDMNFQMFDMNFQMFDMNCQMFDGDYYLQSDCIIDLPDCGSSPYKPPNDLPKNLTLDDLSISSFGDGSEKVI